MAVAFFRRGEDRGDGVAQDVQEALATVLHFIADRRLADDERMLAFVLTGADPSVLTDVAGSGMTRQLFGGRGRELVTGDAGRRLSRAVADVDTEVVLRWARLLESGESSWGGRYEMGPVGGRRWPELLLAYADLTTPAGEPLPFSADDLGRLLAADGLTLTDLLTAALEVDRGARWTDHGGRTALRRLPGFGDVLLAHEAAVLQATGSGPVEARDQALSLLRALDADGLAHFAPTVVGAAVAKAHVVQQRGLRLVGGLDPAVLRDTLRGLATGGKPDERLRALELLRARALSDGDDALVAWTGETAAADRAASVRGLLEAWRATETVVEAEEVAVPDLPPVDWAVPAEEADAVLAPFVERAQGFLDRINDHQRTLASEESARTGTPVEPRLLPTAAALAARVRAALVADTPVTVPVPDVADYRRIPSRAVLPVIGRCGAVAAVQLLRALDLLPDGDLHRYEWPEALERVHATHGGPGLDRWQQLFDGVGTDGAAAIWSAYDVRWGAPLAEHWPDDDVWPYVARNLDTVLAAGRGPAYYRALTTLPSPPAPVVDDLYAVALGTQRSDRDVAQRALARDPGRTARAAAALGDGRGEVRGAAAQWLARIADPASLPALQDAWATERDEVVRGHLLDALDALGEPVGDYLDVPGTTAVAEKFVGRGLPAALSWLAWDAVPPVRWEADDEPVPLAVVQWLVGTAVKARSPEPGALLRRYADLVRVDDREALGAHLLAAWMAEDLRPVDLADAEAKALRVAGDYVRWYGRHADSEYYGRTAEEVAATLLPSYAREPAGSAAPSKGLLAVVAATGGRDVVAPAERYLKEWYGQRAAQGKALIAMLAWVDDPSATQLVLSVGSRFRTKSFQQEASRQAEALAERKGWTVDELSDRTIPTGGFDAGGLLELSYGERVFTARLQPDLTVVLHDPDGTVVKSLPQPRQSDDADLAKEARKAFTAARKDVKAITSLQGQRLYEALCTGRSWPADDWRRYLVEHPLVGPAIRRLVWVALDEDGGVVTAFRPLDDGTLSDVDDGEVVLEPHHRVVLAHDTVLPPDDVRAWLEHLADYEVDPLFPQLGKAPYELAEERRSETEVTDWVGHLVEAFALRGRALEAGYTRGGTEDAGWFYSYRKRFPTLGLVAQVGFSGNVLPEEDRTVALTELTFHREVGERLTDLALGDVPPVLLSEVAGDVRSFAADGPGFDPDWQRTTAY